MLHKTLSEVTFKWLIFGIFVFASMTHIPNYIKLFGYSLTNSLAVGLMVLMFFHIDYKQLPSLVTRVKWIVPFMLFLGYGIGVTFFQDGFMQKSSFQNLFVYLAFFVTLLFSLTSKKPSEVMMQVFFDRAFIVLFTLVFIIEAVELSTFGLEWGHNMIKKTIAHVDARSLVMVVLLSMSWYISSWVTTRKLSQFLIALSGFVLIYLSLSRMAVLTALAIVAIGFLLVGIKNSKKEFVTMISTFVFLLLVTLGTDTLLKTRYINSFNFALQQSNNLENGKIVEKIIKIDTSGRNVLWGELFESFEKSPIIGQGIGSSEVIERESVWKHFAQVQPCNDHLRLLHDVGLIGYVLFSIQVILWIKLFIKYYARKMSTNIVKLFSLNAMLSLFVVSLLAVTDNPIVFSYVMLPLAVVVGIALGLVRGYEDENLTHS